MRSAIVPCTTWVPAAVTTFAACSALAAAAALPPDWVAVTRTVAVRPAIVRTLHCVRRSPRSERGCTAPDFTSIIVLSGASSTGSPLLRFQWQGATRPDICNWCRTWCTPLQLFLQVWMGAAAQGRLLFSRHAAAVTYAEAIAHTFSPWRLDGFDCCCQRWGRCYCTVGAFLNPMHLKPGNPMLTLSLLPVITPFGKVSAVCTPTQVSGCDALANVGKQSRLSAVPTATCKTTKSE